MLSQAIWWVENILIVFLLFQSLWGSFYTKYPIFYSYLSYVLIESFVRFYVYVFHIDSYETVYWSTQFLSVALGYCVIWEIYTQVLKEYPGAARMAQIILLLLFLLIFAESIIGVLDKPPRSAAAIPAILERNLRTIQAILLVAMLSLIRYYSIPLGVNLKGMILGYGVFVGVSIISLALRSHMGNVFQPWWQYLQPGAYLLTLIIWCMTLWCYHPNPRPKNTIELEYDYEILTARLGNTIARARNYLVKGVNL